MCRRCWPRSVRRSRPRAFKIASRLSQGAGRIRRAIKPEGKLLVVEMVLPEDGSPSPAILLDLNMMVMLPGHERTVSEFAALLKSTGFEITRVVPTESPAVLFEARPV